jgi:hypothetical protein
VFELLSDVPASASHFPKVDKLTDLGDGLYQREMQKVGVSEANIQTIHASKDVSDKTKGTAKWAPVKGVGNALVGGSRTLADNKRWANTTPAIQGEIEVPPPGLMKMVVAPVVEGEFEKRIGGYIANLIKRFGGEVKNPALSGGAARVPMRAAQPRRRCVLLSVDLKRHGIGGLDCLLVFQRLQRHRLVTTRLF